MRTDQKTSSDPLVCYCNNVHRQQIQQAIASGATTLDSVYEACGAGVGPCGGTCRVKIRTLINEGSPKTAAPTSLSKAWDPPSELVEAISLFNRRYYWEAHEVLEELWLEVRGPERLFYQGIIQAAAAFYHVLNANPRGVLKLAQDSQDKLKKYFPNYETIPLKELFDTLEDFKTQAREILGNTRTGFDYDKLPKIPIEENSQRR